jgi:hypothetical protein
LDPAAPTCSVREDIKRGVYVDGLSEELVTCPADALRLLQTGALNRHVASTSMNRESSRSHSIFTLIIQSKVFNDEFMEISQSYNGRLLMAILLMFGNLGLISLI